MSEQAKERAPWAVETIRWFRVYDDNRQYLGNISVEEHFGGLWIDNLIVDKADWRGKGIGTALLEAALVEYGHRELWGRVAASRAGTADEELFAWYSRYGFEMVEGTPGIIRRPAARFKTDAEEQEDLLREVESWDSTLMDGLEDDDPSVIQLSATDSAVFVEAYVNAPSPSERMKRLAQRHAVEVEERGETKL